MSKSHSAKIFVSAIALMIAGCASNSEDISAAYVSPVKYANWSCSQLSREAERVSIRAAEVSGAQDSKASGDAVATGVAVILFWPAAFLIKGDGTTAAELARLKGEMEAIEAASIQKNCGIQFHRAPPPG